MDNLSALPSTQKDIVLKGIKNTRNTFWPTMSDSPRNLHNPKNRVTQEQSVIIRPKAMPASFLLNMSYDPAAPFSRFQVQSRNITERNQTISDPKILEQSMLFRCNGASSVSPTIQRSDELLPSNSLQSHSRPVETPSLANFKSSLNNRVTFRKPIRQSMYSRRGDIQE